VKIPSAFVHALTPIFAATSSIRRRMIPPQLAVMEMATGIWPALALRAFVKAGIANRLNEGAASPGDIARDLSLHEESVRRVLRFLAGYDIVHESRGVYTLTEMGHCAADASPDSVADFLRYAGEMWHLEPWSRLDETLRTGKPAFEVTYGSGFFEYTKAHPAAGELFDRAMNAAAKLHAHAIAEAYDFSTGSPVADVGGGSGLVLQAILERYPRVRAVLYDLPGAVAAARIQLARFSDRVEYIEGDFFDAVPPATTYVLTHILHDWDDERALRILANIGRSIAPNGRLLVAEALSEEDPNTWSPASLTDAQMLTMLTGRERTRGEFQALLAKAGFRVKRVIPTSAAESIIECAAA
jgi:SAM-dependent methyltransferase